MKKKKTPKRKQLQYVKHTSKHTLPSVYLFLFPLQQQQKKPLKKVQTTASQKMKQAGRAFPSSCLTSNFHYHQCLFFTLDFAYERAVFPGKISPFVKMPCQVGEKGRKLTRRESEVSQTSVGKLLFLFYSRVNVLG
uniref:(northern house mosquito) hypothetical protein n=1 Tax=Culex pipiens TaxID=7175 RepID=A0A8D8CN65_CULPI